jgi:hypothetical protein
MSLRDALMDDDSEVAADLKVRMGINLGPVKILKDINNQMNMIGDGINAAERIMSFSEPGQLLVSRSYYDIVSCLSQEYAQLFHYQGSRADKHVREHDLYAVEHTRIKPGSIYNRQDRKQGCIYTEDISDADSFKPAAEESYRVYPKKAGKTAPAGKVRKMMLIGGIAAAVIAFLVIFIPGGKAPPESPKAVANITQTAGDNTMVQPSKTADPAKPLPKQNSSLPAKETTPQKTASNTVAEPARKAIKNVSSRAGDILFTVIGVKSLGNETILSVQTYNSSSVAKRVALYDDAYWWSKSQITDEAGEKYDVNKVVFLKGAEKIAMSFTGTQGIHIDPQKSVIANLVFKKALKSIKTLDLHPFICHEGNCTEHTLVMNLGK